MNFLQFVISNFCYLTIFQCFDYYVCILNYSRHAAFFYLFSRIQNDYWLIIFLLSLFSTLDAVELASNY